MADKTYSREQLIEAQKKYFQRYVSNPYDFNDPSNPENYSDEAAEGVIDYLLNLVE